MINSRNPNYLFLQQTITHSKTFVFTAIVAAILAVSVQADTITITGTESGGVTDSDAHSLADDGTTPAVTSTGGTSSVPNTLSGALTLTGNSTFQTGTVGGSSVDDYLTVSGVISGSSNFTKTGAGQLTLTAANTYSGTTTISGGTLTLSESGKLASTSITVSTGAKLLYNDVVPNNASALTITVNGGELEFYNTKAETTHKATNAICSGTSGQGVTINGTGATLTIDGGGTVSAIAANGKSTLKIAMDANSVFNLNSGRFINGGYSSQNWASNYSSLVIGSTGILDLWDGTMMQVGALTGEQGALIDSTASGAVGNATRKGLIFGAGITDSSSISIYNGTINCKYRPTIRKIGAGTQILNGTISNVTLQANAGVLKVNNTITNSDVTVGGGKFDIGSDSSVSYALDLDGSLTLSSGSVGFDFNSLTFDTLNATTFTISGGNIAVNFATNQEQAWFNNGTDGYRIVSSTYDSTADLTSYLSGTTLSGWTLTQKEDGIWLSSSPTLSDSLYWNPASDSLTDSWAIDGANKVGVRYNSGDVKAATHSGTVTQTFKSTYDIAEGYNLTQSGVISGVGNLIKTGDGTLTLTAANTYTGETIVSDGTLALSGSGKIAASSITVEEGATLLYDNTVPHNTALQTITINGGTVEFYNTTESTTHTSNNAICSGVAGQDVTINGTNATMIIDGGGAVSAIAGSGKSTLTIALDSNSIIDVKSGLFINGGYATQNWGNNFAELHIGATGKVELWDGKQMQVGGLSGETGAQLVETKSGNGIVIGAGVTADETFVYNGTIALNGKALKYIGAGTQYLKGDISNVNLTASAGTLVFGAAGKDITIGKTSIIATSDSGVIRVDGNVVIDTSYVTASGAWTGNGAIKVNTGGQFRINGTLNFDKGVTLNGGMIFNDGERSGKTATLNGPVTVASDSKMQCGWSGSLTLTQGLYGSGAINVNSDSGWIYVTAEGDYTGSITAQGKLRAGAVNTGSVDSLILADSFIGTKTITLNGGTLGNNNNYLEFTNDLNVIAASNLQAGWSKGVTFSGALSGAGNMTIANDSGWVNMATDASQYTGAFTVAGKMGMGAYGTDVPDSAAYIGNKTITLNGGSLGNNYNDAVYTNDIVVSANSSLQARGENKTTTLTGALSGTGNLTIAADAGVVVVATTCNNDFSGNVVAANGTGSFRLGADNPFGSSVGTATIGGTMDMNGYNQAFTGLISASGYGLVKNSSESPSTLTLNVADEASNIYNGTIEDDVKVVKNGTGTQTFNGESSYSGGTDINAGTLVAGSSTALGTGAVNVNGGTLQVGADPLVPLTLTVGNTQLTSGIIDFDFNANGFDAIEADTFALSGGTFNINFPTEQEQAWFNNGSEGYKILSATFDTTADLTSYLTGTTLTGWTLSQKEDGIWLYSNGSVANPYWNPSSDSLTDAWTIDGANKVGVLFDSGETTELTHSGAVTQTFKSTYDIAEGYNLTQSGVISGSANMIKTGDGTLTLTAANTFTGETIVSDGTLTLSGDGKLASPSITVEDGAKLLYDNTVPHNGAAQTINIEEGATVEFNMTTTGRSASTAISQGKLVTFTGDGTFVKSGSGDLWLQSANTQPVTFALSSKAKIIIEDGKFSNGGWKNQTWTDNESQLIMKSTATLDLWNGKSIQVSGLTGEAGSQIICGESSPEGMIFGKSVSADETYTYNGTINCANRPTFTKVGAGTQVFNGSITNAAFVINEGVLEINGNVDAEKSLFTVNGGTLKLGGTATLSAGAVTNNGTIEFAHSVDVEIGNAISGTGALVKSGSGTLTLTQEPGYTGSTTVKSGTLALTEGGTLYNLSGGSLKADGTIDVNATLNAAGKDLVLCNSELSTFIGSITAKTIEKTDDETLKIYAEASQGGVHAESFVVSSGRLDLKELFYGQLYVASGATFSPGNSVGTLTIDSFTIGETLYGGGFTLNESGAKLLMEIGGAEAEQNDILIVNGDITLNDGLIYLELADDSTLQPGERFTMVLSGNNSEAFANDPNFIDTYVRSSDFTDLEYVPLTSGDYIGKFAITGRSYNLNEIPEPSTWALLILGAAGLLYFRKRK